jgi:hypothetical protein
MAEGDGEGKAMRAAGAVHGWESKGPARARRPTGPGETARRTDRAAGQGRRMEWSGWVLYFFPGMVVQHSGGWLARPDELDGRRIRPCPLCARGPRARLHHRDENDVERR